MYTEVEIDAFSANKAKFPELLQEVQCRHRYTFMQYGLPIADT